MSNDASKETPKFSFASSASGSGSSIFGGGGNNNTSGGSLFGGGNKPAGGSVFGGGSNQGATGSSGSSLFGGSNTPASTGASQPSLFGGAGTSGGGSVFGGGAGASNDSPFKQGGTSAAPSGSSTPAHKSTFSFGGSTTPAGPPPSSSTGAFGAQTSGQQTSGTNSTAGSFSAFGGGTNASKPTGGLFGGLGGAQASGTQPAPGTSASNASTPAQGQTNGGGFTLGGASTGNRPSFSLGGTGAPSGSPFSGGNTPGGSQPGQSQDASKPAGSSLFNLGSSTGNKPAFSLGGTSSAAQSTPGTQASSTFPSLNAGSSQPASSQPPASTANDKPNLFGVSGSTLPPSGLGGIFSSGAKDKDKEAGSAGAAPPQTPATSSAFNLFSKPGDTPASIAASKSTSGSVTPAASGFKLGSTPAQSSGASQPATTASSTPGFSLGNLGSTTGQSSSTSASQPATMPTPGATTAAATAAPAGGANLGASTMGQPPSAQSRLKNKSMDEIITRWATDLSKYQKNFQSQAKQVAEWDRMLVENSDKISKLYSKTFQARKDTEEVERQLTAVENDQAELSRWLDNYEKEVDDMMDKMVGGVEGLQGPDQERERTYKLAEKLSDRLNDLNKDLSEMIEEINSVSATLSKTDKPDDPLSQVVRVLNTHLSQLQAIDTGAAELHQKVVTAQKEAQNYRVNGQAMLGNDAADDFYRSFMARR